MKRFLALLMIGIMAFSMTVYAADIDVTSLSLDELVELRDKVLLEIQDRTAAETSMINAGVYEAGVTIKEGVYTLTVPEDGKGRIEIFDNIEDAHGINSTEIQNLDPGESFDAVMIKPAVMKLEGTFIITEKNASWMITPEE